MSKDGKKIYWAGVLRLSLSDLWHEWILTLCLVMAVSAVLSPLLILFGLKFGTVEVLRYRLVQDPRNSEIRPMASKSFTPEWFDRIRARDDVSFIIPTTRQISASVDAQVKGGSDALKSGLDLVPTGEGDRLILENGAVIPGKGECVLTQGAAEAIGANPGDTIRITAKRLKNNRYETGELDLTVTGVLSPRAGTLKNMYVPLEFLEAVEKFKDGRAVPEYGWAGATPRAYPVYDGLMVILPKELRTIEELELVNNSGFSKIKKVKPDELVELAGYSVSPDRFVYFMSTRRKPVDEDSIAAVKRRLLGKDAVTIPWVRDLEADLGDTGIGVMSLSVDSEKGVEIGLDPMPEWDVYVEEDPSEQWRQVMVPLDVKVSREVGLSMSRGNETLSFPAFVDTLPSMNDSVIVPARLAGVMNLFRSRNVSFDPGTEEFELARRGYAGFRMYASSIDDVAGLQKSLEDEGIPVSTQADRIRDVMELDSYLTLIFLLIATVAMVGGAASLMASLYASVERKRRDLSILRLLGLSGGVLLRFPVYQGAVIAGSGFAVAYGFFVLVARVINTLFTDHLQAEESLCRLDPIHLWAALAGTIGLAVVVGCVAAWRVTRIDPAEALRDE